MTHKYIATTLASDIPKDRQIVMVDGTVPDWQIREGDLHFDHHKPGGAPIQILEIPGETKIDDDAIFVTTQVDADACAAAAWLQLLTTAKKFGLTEEILESIKWKLQAIAYDCDHLGCPIEQQEYMELWQFARDAVATLKLSGKSLKSEMGLPESKQLWSAQQKLAYNSLAFERGTQWLVDAALGDCEWPGEKGEALAYWDAYDRESPCIHFRCRMYKGVGILDSRGIPSYVDPRHLIDWVRSQPNHANITLTVRDRVLELFHTEEELILQKQGESKIENCETAWQINLAAFNYTLGCVPLHELGSPQFSEKGVWEVLSKAERDKRFYLNLPMPTGGWGGRNEVGGSSWNDAAILAPEEVIDAVLQLFQ